MRAHGCQLLICNFIYYSVVLSLFSPIWFLVERLELTTVEFLSDELNSVSNILLKVRVSINQGGPDTLLDLIISTGLLSNE